LLLPRNVLFAGFILRSEYRWRKLGYAEKEKRLFACDFLLCLERKTAGRKSKEELTMNQVKVSIARKDYILQTTEEERYVVELAKILDKKIRDIMGNDRALPLTTACILAGMDILDEKAKALGESDNLRFQIKKYIDEATKAEARAEELQKKMEKLEQENKDLWNEINLYTLKEKLDDDGK
jgi:cell division protein ZapA (FtsZ GTPase activity inhibitor)